MESVEVQKGPKHFQSARGSLSRSSTVALQSFTKLLLVAYMDSLSRLCAAHPGYESLVAQMHTLLTTFPPEFIYIHDPVAPRQSATALGALLSSLAQEDVSRHIRFAQINAVACYTPRLLYDTVINSLAEHQPNWTDACVNWGSGAERWDENFDGFTHGLRAICAHAQKEDGESVSSTRIVVVIERAERLKEVMPELVVPLTRLRELVRHKFLSLMSIPATNYT